RGSQDGGTVPREDPAKEKPPVQQSVPGVNGKEFTNSFGMQFVLVPRGGKAWLYGGAPREGGAGLPGGTQVEGKQDFYFGKYEVTQEEWEKVMGNNPSHFSRKGPGAAAVKDIPDAELKRFPVETVSWEDVQQFLAELNQRDKQEGWVYRLPKELEW